MEWALSKAPSLGASKSAAEPLVGIMEEFMAVMLNVVQYPPVPLACHGVDGVKDNEVSHWTERAWRACQDVDEVPFAFLMYSDRGCTSTESDCSWKLSTA